MQEERMVRLHKANYEVTYNLLYALENGKRISDYLRLHNYKRVVIYGGNRLGELIKDSLDKCPDIQIAAVMDQAADRWEQGYWGVPVVRPEAFVTMTDIDAVIVVPVFYYEDILKNLTRLRTDIPIISLNTIAERLCSEAYDEKR